MTLSLQYKMQRAVFLTRCTIVCALLTIYIAHSNPINDNFNPADFGFPGYMVEDLNEEDFCVQMGYEFLSNPDADFTFPGAKELMDMICKDNNDGSSLQSK
jgi:hypothetical protein